MKNFIITSLIILQSLASAGAGVYSENTWDKKEIVVCFADGEKDLRQESGFTIKVRNWNKSDKKLMETWVNEEFSSARTGIFYTGWKMCSEETSADVVLFYNSNSYIKRAIFGDIDGLAGELGPRTENSVNGFPDARSIVVISKTGMNKGTVIHEFGHVAGLAHEHNHYQAPENDKCSHYKRIFTTLLEYTDFDRQSIMNYCSLKLNKLSEGDVSLLRRLYL